MKVIAEDYKKSLKDSKLFDADTIDTIWDFYVTHSVAASSGQCRKAADYGLKELPYEGLMKIAGIPKGRYEMLMADNIKPVLEEYGLVLKEKRNQEDIFLEIDIDEPRVLCIQPYSIKGREKPEGRISRPDCLLTHIRNSLAHANTYWFPNDNVLLEDKAGGSSGKTTAAILIRAQSLVEWIKAIDIEGRYYFKGESRDQYVSFVTRASKTSSH